MCSAERSQMISSRGKKEQMVKEPPALLPC